MQNKLLRIPDKNRDKLEVVNSSGISNYKSLWIGIGLFVAAVLAGLFFLRKPQPAPTTTQASPTPETGTTSQPTGERIRLTFENTGNLPHNFTIDELGVATKTIAGGQTDVVEFTAGASGTFTFYCSLAGHQKLGMEGDLEVQ